MSAFICSQEHINAIVNFWCSTNEDLYIYMPEIEKPLIYSAHDCSDFEMVGQILTDANYKSVNYRYDENEEPEKYKNDIFARSYPPVQILKALDCLTYQSCEFDGYYESLAYMIVEEIRHKAICKLPGYDESQWEITETVNQ
jgi:hypothetical protein